MTVKESIESQDAPGAIGPYSQAVRSGGLIFTAGQIGLDPRTGEFAGEDVESQTRRALANLEAVLRAAGVGPRDVLKTTIFLADLEDFERVNELYGDFFSEPYPARSTVEASRLPRDARVEIEVVAAAGGS